MPTPRRRSISRPVHHAGAPLASLALCAALISGCTGGPESVKDPAAVLSVSGQMREKYFDAMEAARLRGVDDATKAALRRMVTADGYADEARKRAFGLLYETDPKALVATLEKNLPTMPHATWRKRASELIAERGMKEMIPALIRAWANPMPLLEVGGVRPERAALGRLVGEDEVSATLLKTMREANPLTQANLRVRCWEMLMKSGDATRLRALLADGESTRGDAMLADLARIANELGVLPTTREEVLWARKLCDEEHAAFFADAKLALARMPADRREGLEIRGVPVAVAALKRRPAVLTMPDDDLFLEIEARIKGRKKVSPDFTGYGSGFTESLGRQRESFAWTDLAAMVLALDVLEERPLRAHLFEVADRDREDRSTEYGGVVSLRARGAGTEAGDGSSAGAFSAEFMEFEPRAKNGDIRYESPQALFDALYTGFFHVHFHAQNYDNDRYAGPHLGDFAFSDSARCNGLVFTFLSTDQLGVDFYRHGRVVVDLGAIERPEG